MKDLPHDEPHVAASRFFMGSNVWLNPALLPVKDIRQPVEKYHATLSALTIQVLRIVEDFMPYGKDIFDDFVANRFQSPRWVLYTIRRREN